MDSDGGNVTEAIDLNSELRDSLEPVIAYVPWSIQ